ncbi:sensor histidine kinase [Aquabacterium sp.]|uniref:sensor histidine kinase n=1 Tax=Aquabacterium sp. TaxID=1872578 RepID=UPI002BBA25DC|nr:histidine kinase [Aquabacterium sp.]HSW05701.1 histidine kinase [Aquabacterium sp.]
MPVREASPAPGAAAPAASPSAGFLLAWALFWGLQLTVELQDAWRHGDPSAWRPLLWVGSSFVMASLIAWPQWRRAWRLDAQLTRPWRWFWATLRTLPLLAPAFVTGVYALRHGVFALLGQTYRHETWPVVFGYEMLKFGMFYLLFVAVVFGIRSHAALSQARIGLEQERRLAQQAQLLQLAQQIEPHFLFNALNTIASTIHSNPDLADHLLTRLAALLRAATDLARQPETTLDEELRLLDAYAAIMCQRFADRVTLRFDIEPAARACRVPTLLLQPLLENAFRHGVERRPGPCHIRVSASRQGERLQLAVADDAGTLPPSCAMPAWGVGLSNLQQRLQARHGDAATLTLTARDGGGVQARIELPCVC